jgi:hypothetical protein
MVSSLLLWRLLASVVSEHSLSLSIPLWRLLASFVVVYSFSLSIPPWRQPTSVVVARSSSFSIHLLRLPASVVATHSAAHSSSLSISLMASGLLPWRLPASVVAAHSPSLDSSDDLCCGFNAPSASSETLGRGHSVIRRVFARCGWNGNRSVSGVTGGSRDSHSLPKFSMRPSAYLFVCPLTPSCLLYPSIDTTALLAPTFYLSFAQVSPIACCSSA